MPALILAYVWGLTVCDADAQVIVYRNEAVYPAYLVTVELKHNPPFPYWEPVINRLIAAGDVEAVPRAAWINLLA